MTTDLDPGFAPVMTTLAGAGVTPDYTEMTARLGPNPDERREPMHKTVAVALGWMHPGTDHLTSFPPSKSRPTHIGSTGEVTR